MIKNKLIILVVKLFIFMWLNESIASDGFYISTINGKDKIFCFNFELVNKIALCKSNNLSVSLPFKILSNIEFFFNEISYETVRVNDENYEKISRTINFLNEKKNTDRGGIEKILIGDKKTENNVTVKKTNITENNKIFYIYNNALILQRSEQNIEHADKESWQPEEDKTKKDKPLQRQQIDTELQMNIEKLRREVERQKILIQVKNDQIWAENEARQAAAEARQLEAEAQAARSAVGSARTEATRRAQAMQNALTQTSTGRQQAQSLVEKQYEAAVTSRVKSFWVLPEMRTWDAGLLAQVVITINKEGEVISIQFDQRSKDPLFDQLVEKTIKSATPMPRFPAVMQQETTESGFKFRPSGVDNL